MKTYTLSALLVISLFFNAITVSVLYDNEDYISLQDEAIQYLGTESNAIHKDQMEIDALRQASKFMLEHCNPSAMNRAIKATLLPKIGG